MKTLQNMTEQELREYCILVCQNIEKAAKQLDVERPLFCVVMFNDPKVAQYASNCRRSDIITAMRETADRLENREDVTR